MGLSFDGLASGLDTTAIIDALMDVEAIPRTLLSAKSDDRRVVITQLQSLNTALQKLLSTAKDATGATALAQVKTSSSDPSVSVAARPGAATVSTATYSPLMAGAACTCSPPVRAASAAML